MWSASMLVTTASTGCQVQERRVRLVGLGHQELAAAQARVGIRRRAGGRRSRRSDRGRLRRAPRRSGWWSWSCRACRPRRCPASGASARPASARAARPGCRARAPRPLPGCRRRPRSTPRRRRRRRCWPRRGRWRCVAPEPRQAPRHRAVGEIGARHAVALRHQHLGDAAHAGAADADEVHALDLVLHARRARARGRRRPRARPRRACPARTRRLAIASAPRAVERRAARSARRCAVSVVLRHLPRRAASTRNCALALCSSATAPGSGTTIAPSPTAASSGR